MSARCPYCTKQDPKRNGSRKTHKAGKFWRKSTGHWIKRFWCTRCRKTFSSATSNRKFGQKKRQKNEAVRRLLAGCVSQRETARILNLNRKTVVRKFLFIAREEQEALVAWNRKFPPCAEVEFDDLETFEHTKCKPLSVTMVVEFRTRRILGFEVASMPAKGRLAAVSRRKYGPRLDERAEKRRGLFTQMKPLVHPQALIRSDSSPHYPEDVRRFFPGGRHVAVLGARGAVTGQGELKKLRFDPLFTLNHTFAMFRANINRLVRKTWCTTKKAERLRAHIAIYAMSHNRRVSTA